MNLSNESRKSIAFACALLNALSAGSLLIFSLYGPVFQAELGYSNLQINVVSLAGELGMYLVVPALGWAVDTHGPALVSVCAALAFAAGYSLAALSFARRWSWWLTVLAFLCVGVGTCAMYLSAVTTCAKNYASRRGLAISVPVAAFGLSSLWQAQAASHFFVGADGRLKCGQLYAAFAVYLGAVGLVGGMGLQIVHEDGGGDRGEDERPLLRERTHSAHSFSETTHTFLKNHSMWWYGLGILLSAGPGEMLINNMGTLLGTLGIPGADPTPHVSMIALTSTLARIGSGLLSDWCGAAGYSRMWLLIACTLLMACGHLFVASGVLQRHDGHSDGTRWFYAVSGTVGLSYGAIFTLLPTIVSVIYGVENFGTNWGLLAPTAALGAVVYGLIYAGVYDHAAGADGLCRGVHCYQATFLSSGTSVLLAVMVWIFLWHRFKLDARIKV